MRDETGKGTRAEETRRKFRPASSEERIAQESVFSPPVRAEGQRDREGEGRALGAGQDNSISSAECGFF